jgi:hypothetical protein
VEGSCEHGNEPSGSINCREVHGVAAQLAASQEGLSSMSERVSEEFHQILLCAHIPCAFE